MNQPQTTEKDKQKHLPMDCVHERSSTIEQQRIHKQLHVTKHWRFRCSVWRYYVNIRVRTSKVVDNRIKCKVPEIQRELCIQEDWILHHEGHFSTLSLPHNCWTFCRLDRRLDLWKSRVCNATAESGSSHNLCNCVDNCVTNVTNQTVERRPCLLYTSPSPRDA